MKIDPKVSFVANADDLHGKLIEYMLENVVPKTISSHMNQKGYSPIVVGGMAMKQCLNGKYYGMRNADIDVKFIVDDPNAINLITDKQTSFVKSMITHSRSHISKVKKMFPKYINPVILSYNQYVKSNPQIVDNDVNFEHKRESRLFPINVIYYDTRTNQYIRRRLMDVALICKTTTVADFMEFKIIQEHLKSRTLIPFTIKNGTPFATCEWVLFDTLRVLKIYVKQLETNQDTKLENFICKMMCKYMCKVIMSSGGWGKEEKLRQIFEEAMFVVNFNDTSLIFNKTRYLSLEKAMMSMIKFTPAQKSTLRSITKSINMERFS